MGGADQGPFASDLFETRLSAVARASDVIILMLPDTPDVDAVLFGESGVSAGLSPT